jgi:hypothetical protein
MQERTYNRPPLIDTSYTPEIIVGENMDYLTLHYKVYSKCHTPEQVEMAMKKAGFTIEDREKIARLYEELREHGFWAKKINEHGRIVWEHAKKGNVQMIFESSYEPGDPF